MRGVQQPNNNPKPVQEQKTRTATTALCRSLLDVSEAGEAGPLQRRARWFVDPNLGLIHDKNFLCGPFDMGHTKREGVREKSR